MARTIGPRLIAVLLLSWPLGWASLSITLDSLQKLETMSPDEFVTYQRVLHTTTIVPHVLTVFFVGLLFIGAVEGIAWLVRCVWPLRDSQLPPNKPLQPTSGGTAQA